MENTTEHISCNNENQCCVTIIIWQYIENSSGSNGEPWGSPEVKDTFDELELTTEHIFILKMNK